MEAYMTPTTLVVVVASKYGGERDSGAPEPTGPTGPHGAAEPEPTGPTGPRGAAEPRPTGPTGTRDAAELTEGAQSYCSY